MNPVMRNVPVCRATLSFSLSVIQMRLRLFFSKMRQAKHDPDNPGRGRKAALLSAVRDRHMAFHADELRDIARHVETLSVSCK
jgi:hypothetical protein